MSASAKVIGADKVKKRLKHIPGALETELRVVLFDQATSIKDEAIKEIEKPKHGRVYTRQTRWKTSRTWRASAPGEAPAKKSGERMRQITAKKANRKMKPSSRVKFPGIYKLLERGLPNIAPRPLFGPLLKRKSPEVTRAIKSVTSKTIKREARR